MIFVLMGQILAWILIVFGAIRASLGLYVANNFVEPAAYKWASSRFLGSSTAGEAIDQGLTWIAAGIVVGLIATIAKRVKKVPVTEDLLSQK